MVSRVGPCLIATKSDGAAGSFELVRFAAARLVTHHLVVAEGQTVFRACPDSGAVRLVTAEPDLAAATLAGVVGLHRSPSTAVPQAPIEVAPGIVRRFVTHLAADEQPAAAALLDHPSRRVSGLRALLDLAAGQATAWWLTSDAGFTVLDGNETGMWCGTEDEPELAPVSLSGLWCRLVAAVRTSPTV